MVVDKGKIIRVFPLRDYGFKKRVILIQLTGRDIAGIEFHHEKTSLVEGLSAGNFVSINYEIRSKVNEDKIYNNLIGVDIKKIC